jgi:hypothetical protein
LRAVTHIDHDVAMSKRAATPVRFDPPVADRLASFVAANPGMSLSSAANRLVDEALRMAEHPGVIFRSGPTGRRAGLAAGPDVWEVIRAIKSVHAAEPGLNSDDLVNLVSNNTGIALRLVNTADRYWAAYPSEVDAEITAAKRGRGSRRAVLAARAPTAGRIAREPAAVARRDVLGRHRPATPRQGLRRHLGWCGLCPDRTP